MLQKIDLPKNVAKLLIPIGVLAIVLFAADTAIATDLSDPAFTPIGQASIPQIIGRIIRGVIGLTGVLALAMFIYGGFMWMTAAGNSDQVGKAKKTVVWSVLGLVLIFSSYALVNFVMQALNQVNP